MVSHILSLCGVYMGPPEELVHANPSNRDGFWEDETFVRLNDEIMNAMYGAWDVPPVVLEGWEHKPELAALRQQAADLLAQRQDKGPWGWKDPRSSLTLPFWMSLVPDLRIVMCLRNPLEVARSLSARDPLSITFGLRLWHIYQIRILAATKPENRLITHYESFFADPQTEIRRILDFLRLQPSESAFEQACATCTGRMRHHQLDLAVDPRVTLAVRKLYHALCLEAGPVCAQALQLGPAVEQLDLAAEIDRTTLVGGGAVAAGAEQIITLDHSLLERVQIETLSRDQEIRRLGESLSARHQEIGHLSAEIAVRDQQLHRLGEDLLGRNQRIDDLAAEGEAQRSEIGRLTGELSDRDERIHELSTAVGDRDGQLRELIDQSAEKDRELQRLITENSARDGKIRELTDRNADKDRELQRLITENTVQDGWIRTLADEGTSKEAELRQLQTELSVHVVQVRTLTAQGKSQGLRIRQLLKRLVRSRADTLSVEEQLQTVRSALADRQTAVEARDARLRELAAALGNGEQRLRQLTQELCGREAEIRRLQDAGAALQAEAGSLQAEIRRMREENESQRIGRRIKQSITTPYRTCRAAVSRATSGLLRPLLHYRRMRGAAAQLHRRGLDHAARLTRTWTIQRHRNVEQILRAPIFDADWYLKHYPDVAESQVTPLKHFLRHGVAEGRQPSPLFDTSWYLLENPDVGGMGINPLLHFVLYGAVEGRRPIPLWNAQWLMLQNPWGQDSGLHPLAYLTAPGAEGTPNPYFDAAWYKEQYPDVAAAGADPVRHYTNVGWIEGRNPGPLFDNDWYLRQYPDVPGINPLAHYLCYGMAEGRAPHPVLRKTFSGPAPAGPVVFVPEDRPLVSIVVPIHRRWLHALWSLYAIRANSDGVPYEVLLIDDSAFHGPWGVPKLVKNARLVPGSQAEQAGRFASGHYLLWLEQDVLVQPGYLDHLVRLAQSVGLKESDDPYDLGERDGMIYLHGAPSSNSDSCMAKLVCRAAADVRGARYAA
ncbi:MAG: sulfotransferase [Pirellulales bacterium]|nr:sulfotransferase [Pirellulales bacterium]